MFCQIAVSRFRCTSAAIILTFRAWLFILSARMYVQGDSAVFMQMRTSGDFCTKPHGYVSREGWKRDIIIGTDFFHTFSLPCLSPLLAYAHARDASSQWHRLRVCRAPRRPQRYHRWINMTLLSAPLPDKHSRINIQIERRECSALETPKGETACTRVSATMSRFRRRVAPGEISSSSHIEREVVIAMAPSADNVFAIRVHERNDANWNQHASQDLYLCICISCHSYGKSYDQHSAHRLYVKYTISFVCLPCSRTRVACC